MINPREHRSERVNLARFKLEAKRGIGPGITVLIAVAATILMGAFVISKVSRTLFKPTQEIRFEVKDATALVPGIHEVRFRGIPAGTVTKVENGKTPIITVKLQKKYGQVYKDAKAELRPITALQDLNLDIVDPGKPAAGKASYDQPLPTSQTATSVRIDQVLNAFRPDTRAQLRSLIDNLGNGLTDNGARLKEAFVELAPLLRVAGNATEQLGRREDLTTSLVRDTALVTDELGTRDGQLRTLVKDLGDTVASLRDGSGDLDATLRSLPPTVTSVDSSFTALRGALDDVDGAVDRLGPVADRLPSSLEDLERVSDSARPALDALRTPVRKLVPLTGVLPQASTDLQRAVAILRPLTPTVLNKVTTDLVNCEKGVNGFFQWDASMTKFGDVHGLSPRGNLSVGASSSGLIKGPGYGPNPSCVPGGPIGGRPVRESDKR